MPEPMHAPVRQIQGSVRSFVALASDFIQPLRALSPGGEPQVDCDLPLKFRPAAIRLESRLVLRRAARVEQRRQRDCGISCRREVAQRGMRPPLVVIVDPVRNP